MKMILPTLLSCLALLATPVVGRAAPAAALSVHATREGALYHQGETARFVLELKIDGKPATAGEIEWKLLKDGLPLGKSGQVTVRDGRAEVSGKLDEPGFLQLHASYRAQANEKPVYAVAGVGVDPEKISRSLPAPDDFKEYWEAEKVKLAAIPPQARLRPVESLEEGLESFDARIDSVGAPVSGYYVRPSGAAAGSLPILLGVHGAGVRSSLQNVATDWAKRGFLAMDMNAHGLPNGEPDTFYEELAAGKLKNYPTAGRESRDTIYFHDMFLRLVRAIDFLTAQPEWDGKHVIVWGTSQGGYQAIVAAGLDRRVSYFAAGVPAGCDHSGMVVGRIAGWPKLVARQEDGSPEPGSLQAAAYYDAMNFAAFSQAKGGVFTVGFIDAVCPPSSVYAAYNQLPIPKRIYNDLPTGHENSPEAIDFMLRAVLEAAGK